MKRRQFLTLAAFSAALGQSSANNPQQTGLVLDDGFLHHHISPAHPESPARYRAVREAIDAMPGQSHIQQLMPLPSRQTVPWLAQIHSKAHIDAIKTDPETFDNVLLATGGCLAAVDAVMQGHVRNAFCASRPPGHHALNTGREEGFCYFNHIAIAARYAQQKYEVEKVLIIDWDYHHGNGTESAFYSDPSVLFFSTHDQYAYPGTGSPARTGEEAGEGFNINVHLACGTDDKAILAAFEQHLRPALNEFKPDLILVSAGFDSREDDLLGCFAITDNGFSQLTRWVMRLADEFCEGRLVSVLEGGYNIQGNASAAVSHLRALTQH
jgi:acetoin utilization deacetylase AcuC-like enzyme